MSAKGNHTLGPWEAHKASDFNPTANGPYVITGGVSPDPVTEARYLTIAVVKRTRDPNPMWRQAEESEANAHLIAAAPELLEAALVATDTLKALELDDYVNAAIQKLRAAIAKVEGDA